MAPHADLIILGGSVVTVDDARPEAEALAVRGGRIAAVGDEADIRALAGPGTEIVDLAGGCLLPGFVEAHSHPISLALSQDGPVRDIRPATVPDADAVLAAIRRAVADAEAADDGTGAYLYGWDGLLQKGLEEPTRDWLDSLSPARPLVILTNSGHAAYANTAALAAAGITRDTPDPAGGHFARDDAGEPTGKAYEGAAIGMLAGPVLKRMADIAGPTLKATLAGLNRVGITTVSDMAFHAARRPFLDALAAGGELTARLRLYEVSDARLASEVPLANGDDMVRQVGIKTWVDGSPWNGNIATSFPYLDTHATRAVLGLPCDHRGGTNYDKDAYRAIAAAYFAQGWQLACHAQGDISIDLVLDVWEELLAAADPDDGRARRLRLEHCGAMTPAQYTRAGRLGITCSLFAAHIRYWGEVLVDDLFGAPAETWVAARSAVDAGVRISLHNDSPVTPADPLGNIATAVTRRTRAGRVLAPEQHLTVDEALRAQTLDAAWQLHADDIIGSLTPGKYADLVILSEDPRRVAPEDIAEIEIRATYLEGRRV
ncbi:amidohydrolase [Yinghuangia soli]|uniref:Amidohydrolase n=1 Tax=Yinghuangia soli TaxID=2908204 RepID=A0AA41PWI4_9ACTN|nr:amidohydrolase [Yinghuangia soli]MCF2527140.1 amidohydrolase [Yinghuangia soli]